MALVIATPPSERTNPAERNTPEDAKSPQRQTLDPWEIALTRLLNGKSTASLVFQPIIDLKRGRTVGYEALSRFPGPPDEAPDVWFREARRLGRAEALEQLTLKLALASRETLPPKSFLSINVTPQFLGSSSWAEFTEANPNLDRLVIEVTERQAISDYEHVKEVVKDLRKRGASFAVDDAGSDYASLQNVLELRPDFVKLDRAFITDCHIDPAKSAVIEMLREFAAKLNAGVIAMGLETKEELNELMRLDAPLAQGFLLGRPAAEWTTIDPEMSLNMLHEQLASNERCLVGSLVERIHTSPTEEEAAEYLLKNPREGMAAVVDQHERVASIMDRDPAEGLRLLDQPMIVKNYLDVKDVLDKATSRDQANRFDPIAAVDASGKFAGVVRVDSLIRAVIRQPGKSGTKLPGL